LKLVLYGLLVDVLVLNNDVLCHALVQHVFIPNNQTLRIGNFLIWWVAVENVVIAIKGWARPDVGLSIANLLDIVQVAEYYLVIYSCP
jgi:hypothetical protein